MSIGCAPAGEADVSATAQQSRLAAPSGPGSRTALAAFGIVQDDLGSAPRPLNRPVHLDFAADVDFLTVDSASLRIVRVDVPGAPDALGQWTLVGARRLRFDPACPTAPDLSGGGFAPGGSYELRAAATLRSTSGAALGTAWSKAFSVATHAVDDARRTPPALVVRATGEATATTRVELGAAPHTVVPFERDPSTGSVALQCGVALPLNLYSDESTRVRFVLRFDQPLLPGADNVSAEAIQLAWIDGAGTERRLDSELALAQVCGAEPYAEVTLTPKGLLPEGARVVVRVSEQLQDLAGQRGPAAGPRAIDAPTTTLATTTRGQQAVGADTILSDFSSGAWQDAAAAVPSGVAIVTSAGLGASGSFPGGGGPNGDFDVVIRDGETLLLDTAFQVVSGGPGGIPITTQDVVGGRLYVRTLSINVGARLVVVGPNPLRIFATGNVRIDGALDASGGDSIGVTTLNTTNIPEPGAPGGPGGGAGGTGSFETTQSTARGGAGFGAYGTAGRGGLGGESTFSPLGVDGRRAAGGGGGRFAPDTYYRWNGMPVRCQSLIGFDAEPGFPGGAAGFGAESQSARAAGGAIAPDVFTDADAGNDFIGLMSLPGGEVLGELNQLWAGAGGGAGGDAVNGSTFPAGPFNPNGDEKGAGGGGGGGAVAVISLGRITVGPLGTIDVGGGHGGGGENTIFFDRVGGGSGGGSGGMLMLESAVAVQIDAIVAQGTGFAQGLPFYTDSPAQLRHPERPIRALGGQGGAGKDDLCGASPLGPRDWRFDAIPLAAFEGRTDVPPLGDTPNNSSFLACNNGSASDPEGTTPGAGGDGGPGLIQVHVPDSLANFVLPASAGGDPTLSFAPPPVGWADGAFQGRLEPRFASLSSGLSGWIALGGAGFDRATGALDGVDLAPTGLDPLGFLVALGGTFDVTAGGVAGPLPAGHHVRLALDVARAGADGKVDPSTAFSQEHGRMARSVDELGDRTFEYVRYRVDLDQPLNTPTPLAVESLRLPFRF